MSKQTTIDTTIAESIAALVDDGTIQDVINKELKQAVQVAVRNAFTFSGGARSTLQSLVDKTVVDALHASTIKESDVKLELALDEIIKNTVLDNHVQLLANFKGLMTEPIKAYQEITLQDILHTYCDYIASAYDCTDREIDYDTSSDPTYKMLTCTASIEELEGISHWQNRKTAVLHLRVEDADLDVNDNDRIFFDIPLYHWPHINRHDTWDICDIPATTFKRLAYMNDFEVYISALANANCCINGTYGHTLFEEVTPTDMPQIDWS